jgi:hypothetical protein
MNKRMSLLRLNRYKMLIQQHNQMKRVPVFLPVHRVMKEYGYTLQEIRGLPIPTFLTLLRCLEYDYKSEKRGKTK